MMKLDRTRLLVCLAVISTLTGLAVAANAGLLGHKAHKSSSAPRQMLLVFPFDQSTDVNVPPKFGGEIASTFHSMLMGSPKYWATVFIDGLAPVQRAIGENSLKPQDCAVPFSDDKTKPLRLAQLMAADYYLVGSVDDFQFDKVKKVAQMTLSAELVNAKTGKSVEKFTVGGITDESTKSTDEDELRAIAAGKAVQILKDKLLSLAVVDASSMKAGAVLVTPANTSSATSAAKQAKKSSKKSK